MGSPAIGPPITISQIKSHDKQKRKKEKKKRLSIYLNNKGRHETSDVELIIVQPLKKPLGIGNATPPQVVFSINHGVRSKHELKKVHRNL